MARPGSGGSGRGFSGSRSQAPRSRPQSTGNRSASSGRSSGGFTSSSHRSSGGKTIGSAKATNRPMGTGAGPPLEGRPGNTGYGYPPPPGYRPYRRRRSVFFFPIYGGRRRSYHGRSGGRFGQGCLSGFLLLLLSMIVLSAVSSLFRFTDRGGNEVTSTINREPLPAGSVHETGYYFDELGWIESESTLLSGMRAFYKETGVQPYLALVEPLSEGNAEAESNHYAENLYDELFTDEAHFLLVYVENTDSMELGYLAYVCGSAARSVMDEEAIDILYSNIDKYWFNDSIKTAEVFSRAFRETGSTIMKQHTNPNDVLRTLIAFIAIIVIMILLIKWWRAKKDQKNKEQEDLERTLNIPLEKFGDKDLDDLTTKYDD